MDVRIGWRDETVAVRTVVVGVTAGSLALVAAMPRSPVLPVHAPAVVVLTLLLAASVLTRGVLLIGGTSGRISTTSDGVPMMVAALLLAPWAAAVVAVACTLVAIPRYIVTRTAYTIAVRLMIIGTVAEVVRTARSAAASLDSWTVSLGAAAAVGAAVLVGIATLVPVTCLAGEQRLKDHPLLRADSVLDELAEYALGALIAFAASFSFPLVVLAAIAALLGARRVQVFEARREAGLDPLTHVANRAMFSRAGEAEVARCARTQSPMSVVMADLDFFREVNNAHGHAAGDAVLREAATRLAGTCRPYDLAARLGGEEFALLLPETGIREATEIAERLRQAIAANPVTVADDTEIRCTTSVGVAELHGNESFADVVRRADEVLYEAKRAGRNTVVAAVMDGSRA